MAVQISKTAWLAADQHNFITYIKWPITGKQGLHKCKTPQDAQRSRWVTRWYPSMHLALQAIVEDLIAKNIILKKLKDSLDYTVSDKELNTLKSFISLWSRILKKIKKITPTIKPIDLTPFKIKKGSLVIPE